MCTLLGRTAQGRRWILASTSDDPYAAGDQTCVAVAGSCGVVQLVDASDGGITDSGTLTNATNGPLGEQRVVYHRQ